MNSLVTIVITSFNYGHWLPEAIDSALAQCYHYVEVIVVDDGSTDDTAVVCSRYPGVKYIWQDNAGLSAARNTGLWSSQGEFICFLDADDVLKSNALSEGVLALRANPQWAFAFGTYVLVDVEREIISEPLISTKDISYLQLLKRNYIGMIATVLFRTDILRAHKGFDVMFRACEDYDVYLRLAVNNQIGCYWSCVAEYRQHSESMSSSCYLMLGSVMRALRRHVKNARTSKELRYCLQSGMSYYTELYGQAAIRQTIKSMVIHGRPFVAFRRLLVVLFIAPMAYYFLIRSLLLQALMESWNACFSPRQQPS